MSGGTLDLDDRCTQFPFTCNSRLRVGADDRGASIDPRNPGTFNLTGGTVATDTLWIGSGSHGVMNMSDGVVNTRSDFTLDWSYDAGSQLSMTGGVVNVGTDLRMYRNSSLDLDGGMMLVAGAAKLGFTDNNVTQIPNIAVDISDGLLESADFLMVHGSVVLSGGVLRAASFEDSLSTGTVEINDEGALQFANANEGVAAVEGYINSGFFTTRDPGGVGALVVEIVDVDGTDFTQVSIPSISIPGDFDGDGDVDGDDFLVWQQGFGTLFDGNDFLIWQQNFESGGGSTALPEPSAMLLAAIAGLLYLARRSLPRQRP